MSNKNKYIPLPGGKECKKVNPFEHIDCHVCNDNSDSSKPCTCTKFETFEANNPILPLTEVMPEGEFEGNLDWYHFDGNSWNIQTDEQMALSPVAKNYNSFFKQMASPLKAKEPETSDQIMVLDAVHPFPVNVKVIERRKIYSTVIGIGENQKPFDVMTNRLTLPLVDVVENKERVEQAAERYAKDLYDNNKVEHFQSHFMPFAETITPHFIKGG